MTSNVPRTKVDTVSVHYPATTAVGSNKIVTQASDAVIGTSISTLWKSVGNPINPRSGKRESGGGFFVTHTGSFVEPATAIGICESHKEQIYSGPIHGAYISNPSGIQSNHEAAAEEMNEGSLNSLGTTAISQCAPTNPSASLGTTIAETFREGVPSLPGIQSWERRAGILRDAGSEYLNYQFGWAPLENEINQVANTARNHRDILQNYRHNEGRDVHRRFDFPSEHLSWSEPLSPKDPNGGTPNGTLWHPNPDAEHPRAECTNRVEYTRKRWFEGCFAYGGPAKTDSFGRAIGFGEDADTLFGLQLSPSVLWELTPWSWAVDWFTNAGDLINNVTNFALAGLSLRYGYMMEETISSSYTSYGKHWRFCLDSKGNLARKEVGPCSAGIRTIRKCRAPASPFGFSIGWEGLSPTQLAITAAIGITRLV